MRSRSCLDTYTCEQVVSEMAEETAELDQWKTEAQHWRAHASTVQAESQREGNLVLPWISRDHYVTSAWLYFD